MDKKLHIVSLLYGEAEDRAAFREVQEDDALRREFQAMSEAKFVLDHRPRQRPPADVLGAVFAAADGVPGEADALPKASESATRGRWRDRSPRPGRIAFRRRSFGLAGALLVACLLLAVGVWGLEGTYDLTGGLAASSESSPEAAGQDPAFTADASTPSSVYPVPQGAPVPASPSGADASRAAAAGQLAATLTDEALPQWDAAGEVFELHREVVMLETRSPDSIWDEPALPLEMLPPPSAGPPSGLQQARQPRF